MYTLFTHDYTARHDSNTIVTFADDTTVVGLITDNDETAYRDEVRDLALQPLPQCEQDKQRR
jgi:hypothetical protein